MLSVVFTLGLGRRLLWFTVRDASVKLMRLPPNKSLQATFDPLNIVAFARLHIASSAPEIGCNLLMSKITTQHIGSAGELLVQYKLLKFGVDSAAMATDSGIDLVAYSPKTNRAYTIQVKTKERPNQGGGKGKLALDWNLRESSPAELVAVTDLSTDSVWLFTHAEFERFAQQHSEKGMMKLYMYVDETVRTKKEMALVSQFESYRIENRVLTFF